MPPNEARVSNALASSAPGTTFLILIQLASRIFTFASNQLILRTLSPTVLGIAAQLELYQVSILYFSRESIRLAIQRQPLAQPSTSSRQGSKQAESASRDRQSEASQSVVNVSYLSLLLGIPSAIVFTMLYERLAPRQALETPFFKESVIVTGMASFTELSIEPFFAVIQQHMWYDKRAAVEMPAAFLKSLTTCCAFLYASRIGQDVGALPFALGHLTYSIALIFGYCFSLLWAADERPFSFLPARIRSR
jgi:oligosaccharide translocation protein RFT1